MNGVIQLVDMMAVGVFAISGALAAAERKLDVLGFILFGTITGIGGGTPVAIALALSPQCEGSKNRSNVLVGHRTIGVATDFCSTSDGPVAA